MKTEEGRMSFLSLPDLGTLIFHETSWFSDFHAQTGLYSSLSGLHTTPYGFLSLQLAEGLLPLHNDVRQDLTVNLSLIYTEWPDCYDL